ncbi:uncharacterized protein BJ212DRAFT_774959 [Suillus subaureus]|uniref:Uncharacterized protein n=1 Tax=Suillus subaureus TaxID=48587 RepID=A0A9P7DZT1_9AGAM|nr:uncharacterized protein BJ212DRAFT_774959 [Suillus subaureus]KAG1806975.1 hypothetical protein BJ212DRAFT_774959 [Suillus subaureus]
MDNSPMQSSPSSSVPNKLSISLDFGSASTSADTSGTQWSPVKSPKSALTFAAVWDPEDGMVTFSGTRLLDSSDEYESSSGAITPPDVSDDDFSQAVAADHDRYTSEESTVAAIGTLQDSFKAFLHRVPRNPKFYKQHKHSNTVASSTLDGLDVYSRDPTVRPICRYPSCDKLDTELSCKVPVDISSESGHVSDESFFENTPVITKQTELKSHWSVTTTSTSAHVDVPRVEQKVPESRIPHPLWIADKYQPTFNLTTPPNSPRRRLKKRRPSDCSTPVSPISYSSSSGSTSPISASPTSTLLSPSRSLKSKKSRRLARGSTDDSWVSIEITPFITQRVVEET